MPSISSNSSLATLPSPQQQQQHVNNTSDVAAEIRLREDRLREAIEELQRRRRRDDGDEACVTSAIGDLCQSFLVLYGVRVGIGFLHRALKLARRKSYSSLAEPFYRIPSV